MKAIDLIAWLKQFNPEQNIEVEVNDIGIPYLKVQLPQCLKSIYINSGATITDFSKTL